MEDRDVLLTVAEIAAAFAGFATLAAVFTSGREHDSEEQVAVRFQALLVYSLTTIGFCFVPFIPLWYGYSSESIWYISTWLLAIGITCINVWMALRNRAAVAMTSNLLLIPWISATWAPVVIAGLSLLGVGSNAANYRVALLAILLFSASAFVRIIASLIPISRESQ